MAERAATAALRPHLLSPLLPHAALAAFFAVLGLALTWPLASHVATHVPGAGPDDNMMFLWNIWWVRHALASPDEALFHTPYLFHPHGVDLVLHTHTALNGVLASTVFAWLPLPAAFNATTLVSATLNGWATYLLAWRTVGHRSAAIAAGIFLAASPALAKQLHGHFNLYCAWVLILFVVVLLEAERRRATAWAIAAGVMLAGVALADYYYFVYACGFLLCLLATRTVRPAVETRLRGPRTAADAALLGAAAAASLLALFVWVSGGFVTELGGVQVSMRSGRNVRAAAAALLVWWTWRRLRPRLRLGPADGRLLRTEVRLAAIVLGTGALLLVPVALAALELWRDGGYVSQAYVWRNAPAGADIGTLVLGNPFNGVIGPRVMQIYASLGIDAFSGPLWFGIVPLVLAVTAGRWRAHPAAPLWLLTGTVFLLWTLGPYLLIFGVDTGLPLPQLLMRYVPLAANARTPGHAVVFVALSLAMLLAIVLSSIHIRWRTRAALVVMTVLLLDFWSAPIALHRLEQPAVYAALDGMPAGAVLELPVGMRDGFGEEGRFDPNVLYYQTLHGRRMAGGYIARLSPAVAHAYRTSPFGTLLKLSAGNDLEDSQDASAGTVRTFLAETGIHYIVVNEALASPALQRYVEGMQLTPIASDGKRHLYGLP